MADANCPLTGNGDCGLDEMREAVKSLSDRFARVEGMADKVEEHRRALFGNGHEGIKITVTKMNVKMSAVLWLFAVFIVLLAGNIVTVLLTHGGTP